MTMENGSFTNSTPLPNKRFPRLCLKKNASSCPPKSRQPSVRDGDIEEPEERVTNKSTGRSLSPPKHYIQYCSTPTFITVSRPKYINTSSLLQFTSDSDNHTPELTLNLLQRSKSLNDISDINRSINRSTIHDVSSFNVKNNVKTSECFNENENECKSGTDFRIDANGMNGYIDSDECVGNKEKKNLKININLNAGVKKNLGKNNRRRMKKNENKENFDVGMNVIEDFGVGKSCFGEKNEISMKNGGGDEGLHFKKSVNKAVLNEKHENNDSFNYLLLQEIISSNDDSACLDDSYSVLSGKKMKKKNICINLSSSLESCIFSDEDDILSKSPELKSRRFVGKRNISTRPRIVNDGPIDINASLGMLSILDISPNDNVLQRKTTKIHDNCRVGSDFSTKMLCIIENASKDTVFNSKTARTLDDNPSDKLIQKTRSILVNTSNYNVFNDTTASILHDKPVDNVLGNKLTKNIEYTSIGNVFDGKTASIFNDKPIDNVLGNKFTKIIESSSIGNVFDSKTTRILDDSPIDLDLSCKPPSLSDNRPIDVNPSPKTPVLLNDSSIVDLSPKTAGIMDNLYGEVWRSTPGLFKKTKSRIRKPDSPSTMDHDDIIKRLDDLSLYVKSLTDVKATKLQNGKFLSVDKAKNVAADKKRGVKSKSRLNFDEFDKSNGKLSVNRKGLDVNERDFYYKKRRQSKLHFDKSSGNLTFVKDKNIVDGNIKRGKSRKVDKDDNDANRIKEFHFVDDLFVKDESNKCESVNDVCRTLDFFECEPKKRIECVNGKKDALKTSERKDRFNKENGGISGTKNNVFSVNSNVGEGALNKGRNVDKECSFDKRKCREFGVGMGMNVFGVGKDKEITLNKDLGKNGNKKNVGNNDSNSEKSNIVVLETNKVVSKGFGSLGKNVDENSMNVSERFGEDAWNGFLEISGDNKDMSLDSNDSSPIWSVRKVKRNILSSSSSDSLSDEEGGRIKDIEKQTLKHMGLENNGLEYKSLEHEGVQPKNFKPEGLGSKGLKHKDLESKKVESKILEPKESKHKDSVSKRLEFQNLEPKGLKLEGVEPKRLTHKSLEPKGLKHKDFEPKGLKNKDLEPKGLKHKDMEPKGLESNNFEPKSLKPEGVETKELKHKDLEPKVLKHKGLEPKEFKHKGLEPKKFESKNVEPKGLKHKDIKSKGLESKNLELKGLKPEGVETKESKHKGLEPKSLFGGDSKEQGVLGGKGKEVVRKGANKKLEKGNQVVDKIPDLNEIQMYSFMASLADVPSWRCHPEAKIYKSNFKGKKEELARKLFAMFNENVFEGKMQEDLPIVWNKNLCTTAGRACNKQIRSRDGAMTRRCTVELSVKVVDTPQRLRDTLAHELCHAATWLLDAEAGGHGPKWRAWVARTLRSYPEIGNIPVCHTLDIHFKYTFKCTKCGYSVNRHSKSIDVAKKCCGICFGSLEVLRNKKGKSGLVVTTPVAAARAPSAFALYVKENYGNVRSQHTPHKDAMRLLGKQYASMKVT